MTLRTGTCRSTRSARALLHARMRVVCNDIKPGCAPYGRNDAGTMTYYVQDRSRSCGEGCGVYGCICCLPP